MIFDPSSKMCNQHGDWYNAYLHVLHLHDDDKSFRKIYNHLGECEYDIDRCDIFKRNYRNRMKSNEQNQQEMDNYSIMDKIHCYYQHIYIETVLVDITFPNTEKNQFGHQLQRV